MNSIQKLRGAAICPLGFVKVATPGSQVSLMANLDPSNANAPTAPTAASGQSAYPATVRGVSVQAYNQPSLGSTPVMNSGQIYLLVAPAGGSGNATDAGCVVKVLQPGEDYFYPPPDANLDRISPYYLYLDADNAGDGAYVVGYSGGGG